MLPSDMVGKNLVLISANSYKTVNYAIKMSKFLPKINLTCQQYFIS